MESSLIAHFKPKSAIAEAYKMIRTNLQFLRMKNNLKTLLITSTSSGEGKTTTACNIAIVFAKAGNRTLLLDADLRRPNIHKIFGLENKIGLMHLLLNNEEVYTDCIQKVDIPNLDIITSGGTPQNSSEVLGSDRMIEIIGEIKNNYDIVIVDAPPVGMVTDAAVLSNHVDGVIFIVAFGKIDAVSASRAKDSLIGVGSNVLGVIINKVERRGQGYYGYYGYNYYYSNYYGNKH